MEPINNIDRVFLVSGTSTGLGLSIVKRLLDNNYKVAAFTRSKLIVENEIKKYYENNNEKNIDYLNSLLAVQVDITNEESVENGVKETVNKFGHFDVVINNAGYGQMEARAIFDVNYFAILNIVRSTTPYLRKQKSGLILNVSSIVGHLPKGSISSYVASKYAVTGLTLSLEQELAPFNIKVVLLSPGGFRTIITNKEKFKLVENPIPEYYPNSTPQNSLEAFIGLMNTSNGDPNKFANAILKLDLIHQQGNKLPSNIFFGSDALEGSSHFFKSLIDESNQWKELALSTDRS
ncbi:hypothetical protein DDB_G0271748 [Dictyostelium discoideum AX4]|uniref:Short-chain dehydrogenase/reductase family protein n=1 Tax=Dictyostelium discoideum TaxID=44689 RepID=Q55AS0_DICDI|nr:hypothetical protein DDB_G0271748 [Dictyostelium discoideum AX4]EAL71564.1 hypothetical protein DDB_G0271748 [Dictyostelium discoideum AX4]|eukprot:XP_645452.1 hypothetical protein DDB_G0271748 [Dictyostelium discoideum AX4]